MMPIYATVDKTKKAKCKMPLPAEEVERQNNKNLSDDKFDPNNTVDCNYANIDVIDSKDLSQSQIQELNLNPSESSNYANLEFAHSLEHYENSKELLLKAGITQEEIEKMIKTENESNNSTSGTKFCTKCGHSCNKKGEPPRPGNRQDDYLMMEPTSKSNSSQDSLNKAVGGKQFPGYLPMHPVSNSCAMNKTDLLKLRLQREMGDKSSSTPSLNASFAEACRKRLESETHRVPGSAMLGINHSVSAANSPYFRRRVMGCMNDSMNSSGTLCSPFTRKRSSSADSTKYLDELDSITERTVTSSSGTQIQNSSKNTSIDSISSHSVQVNYSSENNVDANAMQKSMANNGDPSPNYHNLNIENQPLHESRLEERPLNKEENEGDSGLSVNVRRSSSVPCKSGHNRDSSSSNDSGVSIGSLKHRGGDFAEFELPLTTSMSSRRHYHAVQKTPSHQIDCYHSSLPRRSKSVDPMRELSFQFQHIDIPLKSSSAEAEIPVCLGKRESKGTLHFTLLLS